MPKTRRKFLIDLSLATAGLGIPGIIKGSPQDLEAEALFGKRAGTAAYAEIDLSEADFSRVPELDRPWVYYWWLKGNVTRELITRDLEAMKAKGIGGFLLFDSRAYHDGYYDGIIPVPLHIELAFMSPQWLDMVAFTLQEAARLGLQMSINIANSGGALRGPWDFQEQGPKKLIWTAVEAAGSKPVEMVLKVPEDQKYFRDVGLFAVQIEKDTPGKNADNLHEDWNDIVLPAENTPVVQGRVVDLAEHLEDGILKWKAPAGHWRIIRFGTTVIGVKGDVDILDAEVVAKYFTLIGDNLLEKTKGLKAKVLNHLYNVSWEGENPDWTTHFEAEFAKYRGYDIQPHMVMLTGIALQHAAVYKKFMRDYYRTLSDCFKNNCYKTIGALCHDHGIQWHSENGGPWRRFAPMLREADQLDFWGANDMPQGEFWCSNGGDLDKKSNIRYTAMAAHTYGHPLVAVESFTSMGYHWTHYPGFLKPFADINFIDGANFFIWHTFTASPLHIGKPGYEYFAGTHINPNVTWFDKVGPFIQYLGRCQYLLRKGQPVADLCCYVSDKNYVKWGRAKKWNEASALSLAEGYSYDLLDTQTLVHALKFENGQLQLPSGRTYRLLVVDLVEEEIPLEALKKIIGLIRQGAAVVLGATLPKTTPGLSPAENAEEEVVQLAGQLWGRLNDSPTHGSWGSGKVFRNADLQKVLRQYNVLPDFEGPFEYIHKRDAQKDIYFLRGSGHGTCTFRVADKIPEIWDPLNGKVTAVLHYKTTDDGRTTIGMALPENGSVCIVFRKKKQDHHFTAITGPAVPELVRQKGGSILLTAKKTGAYTLTDTRNRTKTVHTQVESPIQLKGPWQLAFHPATGGNTIKKKWRHLQLWNEQQDPEIRYFAGDTTYEQTFAVSEKQHNKPAWLTLEQLFDIARVWVNGEDLGIVWTAPWTVALTGKLKKGQNHLKIEVTNCWRNRLIGDAGLPAAQRKTQTNVRLVANRNRYKNAFEAYAADDPLAPAGLGGPVSIVFGDSKKLSL